LLFEGVRASYGSSEVGLDEWDGEGGVGFAGWPTPRITNRQYSVQEVGVGCWEDGG